jgi:kinesin family protein C2/C3
MMGTPENPGVNRRAVAELFQVCREREDYEYTMTVRNKQMGK